MLCDSSEVWPLSPRCACSRPPKAPALQCTRRAAAARQSIRSRARTRSLAISRANGTSAGRAMTRSRDSRRTSVSCLETWRNSRSTRCRRITVLISTAWGTTAAMARARSRPCTPSASLPQIQPPCLSDATGLVDCGNWGVSASWTVPVDAVSGIYFAKLVDRQRRRHEPRRLHRPRGDRRGAQVRHSVPDVGHHLAGLQQLRWQQPLRGRSGHEPGRAYKVSYNRPLTVRGTAPEDAVFNAEYPMVRFLEANGYDVSYFSGVDTDRFGSQILDHNIFLSVGHDEYWSGPQRTNVEAARAAGVHLAFFSGNEMYWKTRWENSIDGSGTARRTLVSYKETHANAKIDPAGASMWTGTWRDPRFSPPADGGQAGKRADRTAVHGQRRQHELHHRAGCERQGTVLAEHDGGDARGRRHRDDASGHARLRMGCRHRQRVPPERHDRPLLDDASGQRDAARLRIDVRCRDRDPQTLACTGTAAAPSCSAPAPCNGRGASTRRTTVDPRLPTTG